VTRWKSTGILPRCLPCIHPNNWNRMNDFSQRWLTHLPLHSKRHQLEQGLRRSMMRCGYSKTEIQSIKEYATYNVQLK
jgi:hypothetical protein